MAANVESGRAVAQPVRAGSKWPAHALPSIALLLLVLGIVAVYTSTFASMINVWWSSSSFIHCFLILPASAFLAWQRRRTIRELPSTPSALGALALAAAVLAWAISSLAQIQFGQQFSVIAMAVAAVWAIMGTPIAKALRFPLFFAFFAVPFGGFLVWPLMQWTAGFTVAAIQLIGIPVLLEGHRFTLPSGSYQVVEACSGLRYLVVTIVVSVLFAHRTFTDWRKRVGMVAVMAALMVIANGVRAFVIVMVMHYSGMRYGTGREHVMLGLAIFVAFLLLAFWTGSRFADPPESHGENVATVRRDQGFVAGLPALGAVAIVAVLFILAGPVFVESRLAVAGNSSVVPQLPASAAGWRGPLQPQSSYEPSFPHASHRLAGAYSNGADNVEVHVEYYQQQTQGRELIGEQNALFDNEAWELVGSPRAEPAALADAGNIAPKTMLLSHGDQRLLLWYWYDIGGHATTNSLAAKLQHTWNLLRGADSGDALVALAAEANAEDVAAAEGAIRSFLLEHGSRVQACLRPEQDLENSCAPATTLRLRYAR